MVDQAAERLALSQRPLIVDECDHVIERKLIELVRDLYEMSGAAIALIGEERLPAKIERFERLHGRIQAWSQAQPCDLTDARALATFYCPGVEIENALLERLVAKNGGSARRICVNLYEIANHARRLAAPAISLAGWSGMELHTGRPPAARQKLMDEVR
jgi:hypothetical protein